MVEYKPVTPQQQPKFAGIKTFMRLPHTQTSRGIDFAVLGVPWDGATSYRTGQRLGPDAIRKVSVTLRPYNLALGVDIFEHCSGIDYGDLPVVAGYIEDTYTRIEAELCPLIETGVIPVLMGGDHSITLPELRAVAKTHGPVAVIHFDSHTDTNDRYFGKPYYHGSPFRRAVEENILLAEKSIQIGMRGSVYSQDAYADSAELGFEVITMSDVRAMGLPALVETVRQRVGRHKVFVTFDIDVVDPAFAPGTGTPEVGGFSSAEAIGLVQGLAGLNFIGFDLVEVLPDKDPAEITALLAANVIYEFLALIALNKKG
ncbi:Guanidinobutyrase (EC [Olavius algarvensis Delta 1 endosymbiont]|nr:Guanidinobutyrase (EC [Olavius algarvensis Delta 1 endosymbiont]